MTETPAQKRVADERLRFVMFVSLVLFAGATIVLIIDMGLKKDILKYATQVHNDVIEFNRINGRLPREQSTEGRAGSPANSDGSFAGSISLGSVAPVNPGVEAGSDKDSSAKSVRKPGGRQHSGMDRNSGPEIPPGDEQVGT